MDDKELDNLVNNFIEKWIPESYPHLVDTDNNDGERLRQSLVAWKNTEVAEELRELRSQIPLNYNATFIGDAVNSNLSIMRQKIDLRLSQLEKASKTEDLSQDSSLSGNPL